MTIPLYPRYRPLKDLLAKAKIDGHVSIVADEFVDGIPITRAFQDGSIEQRLYNAVTEYFYYADIASDSDEQFIQRFTNRWNMHADEYVKLLTMIRDYSGDKETLIIDGKNVRDTSKETTSTANNTDTETVESEIVMAKGVKTESVQSTENVGNKLTRTTPNENMTVTGDASTTVTDSGEDTDTKNESISKEYVKNESYTDNSTDELKVDTTNVRTKLTSDNINVVRKFNNLVREFVYLFENLFMEVIYD